LTFNGAHLTKRQRFGIAEFALVVVQSENIKALTQLIYFVPQTQVRLTGYYTTIKDATKSFFYAEDF
jgi:hypothetical protein